MIIHEHDETARRVRLLDYARKNDHVGLGEDEINHVANCFESIFRWYEEECPPGSFISSILRNDFKNACFTADEVNLKALPVYAYFLHWELPNDYREKAKDL